MSYQYKREPLSTVQMILGHDHLSTTEIYLNLQPQQVLEEFQRKW